MADKRIDIVELKTDNYQRWRNDLEVALIFAKCSEVVDVEERPADVDVGEWQRMSTSNYFQVSS